MKEFKENLKNYSKEIDNLARDFRKFVKKNKKDIINSIENQIGQKQGEEASEYLIEIREKFNNVDVYLQDEVISEIENISRVKEMVEIYDEIDLRFTKIAKLFSDLFDFIERNKVELKSLKSLDDIYQSFNDVFDVVIEDAEFLNDNY